MMPAAAWRISPSTQLLADLVQLLGEENVKTRFG